MSFTKEQVQAMSKEEFLALSPEDKLAIKQLMLRPEGL
jgi:hypothetical protein